MAEQSELRVILRTVAETAGATQTSNALRQVQQQARQTQSVAAGGIFGASTNDALRFGAALAGVPLGLSAATSAAGILRDVLGESVNAAREHERIIRAIAASYGASATQFQRFATTLSAQTGFTSDAILEAALSARTLSTNYALSTEQTQKLISVSADLAKIRGIGVAESFERVQSAIRGEAEASEFLGLTLNDTFVKNNAMNGSLKNTFETMSDQQKAQIRYTELLRQTAAFTGLASTNTNSLDSAFVKAATSGKNFQLVLGDMAKPATVTGLQQTASALDAISLALKGISQLPPPAFLLFLTPGAPGLIVSQALKVREEETRATREAAEAERDLRNLRQVNEVLTPPVAITAAERRAADQRNRRLLEINELPTQTAAQSLAEIAFLDQRDAAVKEILDSQRESRDLAAETARLHGLEAQATLDILPARQELARIEREIADQVDRRVQLQLEAARIAAEQRATPAREALEDSNLELQRAQLVVADRRGQSPEDRAAARRQVRDITRNVLPGQELAAFDAGAAQRTVERQQRAFDLATRAAQNPLQQRQVDIAARVRPQEDAVGAIRDAIQSQEALANIQAARQDEANRNLGQIIDSAIKQGFLSSSVQVPVQINLTLPDGTTTVIEQLIEANGQAQTPPVIQLSGVRR